MTQTTWLMPAILLSVALSAQAQGAGNGKRAAIDPDGVARLVNDSNGTAQVSVHGATGAALDFRIAGPGSRSYAFVIDWHFRTLAGIAWFAGAWLVGNGGLR